MKRFKVQRTHLLFILMMSIFSIAGCGGDIETGHWLSNRTDTDNTAPTVTFTTPADAAFGVAINTKITATFSEAIDPSTINTIRFTVNGVTAVEGVVAYSGVTAVFTPLRNLDSSTTYTATITTGVRDLAGNALKSVYMWSFTTSSALDTTAPRVSSTIPANAARRVSTNTKITATFDEAMDPLTINAATFTLHDGATAIEGAVTYSGVTAIFIPARNLAAGVTYTATIRTGAKDLANNALARDYTWSFTTYVPDGENPPADNTAPTVTFLKPVDDAVGVPINTKISATFSEAMDPLTITTATFTVNNASAVEGVVAYSGVTAIFTPLSNLENNTTYTVTITTRAEDLAGNALARVYIWNFTTGVSPDAGAPMVSSTIPANGDIDVSTRARITATFSEAMDPLTITTATFTVRQGATVIEGAVTYSGVTAVFKPLHDLIDSLTYTATMSTGARDLAGNAMARSYTWSFKTVIYGGGEPPIEDTAPTVILVNPADGDTDVARNTTITATFSEAMDPLTITTATFTLYQGATTVDGISSMQQGTPLLEGTVIYAGVTAIFTPEIDLLANTEYTATITPGAEDLAGNALADYYIWEFSTGTAMDGIAPTVILTDPDDLETDVALDSAVKATFSEEMKGLTITTATFTVRTSGPPLGPILAGSVNYAPLTDIATFNPSSDFLANTEYTATITTGAEDLAGNALVDDYVWTFTTGAAPGHLGPDSVVLGDAQPYGVLSNTGVTLGGGGVTGLRVDGDVGIFPAGACVGCLPPGASISGVLESGTVAASDAVDALTDAYNDAISRSVNRCTLIDSGILTTNPSAACGGSANGTFKPGLYWSGTSIAIPAGGTITLDAQNDPNAVFIFQAETTINSIGGNTHVVLANMAQAKNVFWVTKTSSTIGGTNSDFAGTVIALVAITVNTGTQMEGRALARGAEVTVQDGALITVPAP